MTDTPRRSGDGFPTATGGQRSLASWYMPGFSDGLGSRLLMFDNTQAPSWELLRFRAELTADPGFETALRGRVMQLSSFRHRGFSAVRGVEDLGSGNGVALVSTYVAGKRLTELLERPRGAAAAIRLIRQLTPALAALQKQGPGVVHGALTTDRIILASGRFLIREHVLGSVLQRLTWPAGRFWTELGIVQTGEGPARLDARADVTQLALIALSLMLGRSVNPAEYPHRIDELLERVARTSGTRAPLAFQQLRRWLERALGVAGRPFDSAQEASDALTGWSDEPYTDEADFELPESPGQAAGWPPLLDAPREAPRTDVDDSPSLSGFDVVESPAAERGGDSGLPWVAPEGAGRSQAPLSVDRGPRAGRAVHAGARDVRADRAPRSDPRLEPRPGRSWTFTEVTDTVDTAPDTASDTASPGGATPSLRWWAPPRHSSRAG